MRINCLVELQGKKLKMRLYNRITTKKTIYRNKLDKKKILEKKLYKKRLHGKK